MAQIKVTLTIAIRSANRASSLFVSKYNAVVAFSKIIERLWRMETPFSSNKYHERMVLFVNNV